MARTPSPNGDRHTLQYSTVLMTGGIHAVVDGEISTNQVRAHGSIFTRYFLGLADRVGLVFAVVHTDDAGEARGALEAVIVWF